MNTYLKNKTYFKIYFLIILLLLFFIPFKVDALVYKNRVDTQFNSSTQNGYFANLNGNNGLPAYLESWVSFSFTNDFPVQTSDYLLFQFVREEYNLFEGENNFCTKYIQTTNNSSTIITCDASTYNSANNVENNLNKSMFVRYADNTIDYCWFDSTMQGYAICPNGKKEIDSFWIHYTGTYRRVEYRLQVSTIIYLYNNDSTEIINGLLGVQSDIANTTTAIEQQTQQQAQQNAYVQNTSTSGAQSTASTEITALSNELTQHMSQFSELTQLVVSPITLFMELNNDVCVPLTLNVPFVGGTAVLPCIKPIMQQYFGGLYSVFTTVVSAIICYWVFVKTVALIKSFLDADDDKIEVIDL